MNRNFSSLACLTIMSIGCGGKASTDAHNGNVPASGGTNTSGSSGGSNPGGSASTSATAPGGLTPVTADELAQVKDAACSIFPVNGIPAPMNFEFIVDTSGSMNDTTNSSEDLRTKWEITKSVLEDTFAAMPRTATVGLLLWPNKMTTPNEYTQPYQETGGVDACVNVSAMVPLAPLGVDGSDQRQALQKALNSATPQGGTPAADAFTTAIERNYGSQAQLPGAKYAIFITDGKPNIQLGCMGAAEERSPVDTQPALDSIKQAFENSGIKTFVIGIPANDSPSIFIDTRSWFSDAALAGNTAVSTGCSSEGPDYCHFDLSRSWDVAASFTEDLQDIFDATSQKPACTHWIDDSVLEPPQIIDRNNIVVVYATNASASSSAAKLVGEASDPSCPEANGWYFEPTDPSNQTIQLCPTTCNLLRQDEGSMLDILVGCHTIMPII